MSPTVVFDDNQVRTLVILERLGGSLSLFSVISIFFAYGLFPRLRSLPNTFIVFASIANAGASIASLIAYDGVALGQESSLCQAQGFLFQMFVQSDPWWSLAMAINVLLVFFMNASPHTIKRWGWLYCLICYGGPFIIAAVCLRLTDPHKTAVYGSAGIWCWISNDWNLLRIYSYYMLIWICILTSLIIYAGIGIYVFRARNKLRQLPGSGGHVRGTLDNPVLDYPSHDTTSQPVPSDWPLTPNTGGAFFGPASPTNNTPTETNARQNSPRSSAGSPFRTSHLTRPDNIYSPSLSGDAKRCLLPPGSARRYSTCKSPGTKSPSLNRPPSQTGRTSNPILRLFGRYLVEDPVKRAYLRTAVLFALSVLVTWIPSSINRIRGLIYPDSPYPYNVATAAVLPLQGVWNGIIFFVTSWKVFRESVADFGKGVVEITDLHPGNRTRATAVGSPWRDVEPAAAERGLGLGIAHVHKESAAPRRDGWDFLDVGAGEVGREEAVGM
ncbi:G-protein coupled receptor [Podospora appendiculata]|uniref:G-protein coupled receptor n=1 Tax=Podospora appendiculata TaxID=314037 RepID=A0AAE0XAC5_9PEZI|nr:G-protein coupled receptor [Podospora appendiculata]